MALSTNLVAYWKLDESSGDASDSVGGFTAVNNGTTGYVAALINNGVDYGTANTTKYMRAASDVGITGGAITISTWIKMRTEIGSATQCIALQGDAGVDVNYIITYEYNAGTRRLGFNRQKQGSSNNWTYGSATLGTASWHHVVLTYDGTNLAGWLDGTQVASNLATSGNGTTGAVDQVFLGHDDGQFANTYLSAYQDETGIWSRALTADEVSQLFNSGRANAYPLTDTPSLYGGIAYYKLDSGALTTDSVASFTLTNTNTVGEGTAKLGTASADFGAANTNKRLEIANDLGIDGASISVSFWVKMNTEIASGTQAFMLHGGATSFVNDMVGYDYNGGTRRIGMNRQRQNQSNNITYYTTTLGTTWHHIVYTYDATNMRGYLDGALVIGPVALSGNGVGGAVDKFMLGHDNGQWLGTYASVLIDEVGVWSRAITAAEVTSLYNGGSGLAYPLTTGSSIFPRKALLGVGR